MGKALLIVILVVLFLFAFYDLIATPKHQVKHLSKPLWFVLLLITPIGPLLWLFFGVSRARPAGGAARAHRPPSRGPDDDPDFLGRL